MGLWFLYGMPRLDQESLPKGIPETHGLEFGRQIAALQLGIRICMAA